MGFRFVGFFARAENSIIQEAQRRWPGSRDEEITEPFRGIVVWRPDPERAETDESAESLRELGYAIEDGLPSWSARFRETLFVFVVADCFGGECFYRGFVCQNGRVEARESPQPRGAGALSRLMSHLGVELGRDEFFAPFTRAGIGRGGESKP